MIRKIDEEVNILYSHISKLDFNQRCGSDLKCVRAAAGRCFFRTRIRIQCLFPSLCWCRDSHASNPLMQNQTVGGPSHICCWNSICLKWIRKLFFVLFFSAPGFWNDYGDDCRLKIRSLFCIKRLISGLKS